MRGSHRIAAMVRQRTVRPENRAEESIGLAFSPDAAPSGVVGDVFRLRGVFYLHIAEFFRVENFATLQAFDKLGVLLPGDDFYPWMSAGARHCSFARERYFLFPPDCSRGPGQIGTANWRTVDGKVKNFSARGKRQKTEEIETPTDSVVYLNGDRSSRTFLC